MVVFAWLLPERLLGFLQANPGSALLFNAGAALVLALFAWYLARTAIKLVLGFTVKRTKTVWDDIMYRNKVFLRAANAVPLMVFHWLAPYFTEFEEILKRLTLALLIMVVLGVFRAMCKSGLEIYDGYEVSREKPLKGVVQIVIILAYIVGAVVIVSILLDKSPALLLSGLGAMTAILMLIFRDTILGFVAGIQIISNNSIRKGDWIVMSKYEADGDVIDIALHAVKVQNWDKTIVSIPTHKFLEESFTNWRGMVEAGGRRICRNINIDVSSIHYLSNQEIDELRKIQLITEYLDWRRAEVREWNNSRKADMTMPVNGRWLTNIGTFREYTRRYLLQHEELRSDMLMLVRQMPPTPSGLPLQVYVFTKTTAWVEYERVQSDIFDHLLAAIGYFGLRVFQNPGGHDLKGLSEKN